MAGGQSATVAGNDHPKPQLPTHGSSKSQQITSSIEKEMTSVSINPLSKPRLRWDLLLSLLVFYNATVIPIYMAYRIGESISDPLFWINRVVDLCFMVDLVLCFETGVYAGELIIMKRHEVHQIYLRSWFLLDLISTIPYDLIAFLIIYPNSEAETFSGSNLAVILHRLTVIEVLKVVRLLKVLKTIHLFNIFEKALVFRYEDMAKIKFTLFVFFCLHWSACIFSWLDENVCENDPDYSVFYASNLSDRGNGARYLASFYWALATMVTIGYGDISARCTATRLFSLIIMFVASAVYAYGLSYVMDVIRKNRKQQEEFRELMDMANKYMDFRKIPHDLREELRKFFNFKSDSEARRNDLLSERLILNELSPELRFAVLRHVNSGLLEKVSFFQEIAEVTKENDILQQVVLHLQSQVFRPSEVIIREGDVSDELFFITKGTCMLVKWGTITTKVLPEGSYHGETGFLANTESYRGSTRFSTPMMKALLSDQVGSDPGPISLKKQTTERSFHNASFTSKPASAGNDSESTSDGEYLQSHTFITQTYADLRYITRTTFNTLILSLPKYKLDRVYRIMARRYELSAAAEEAEEKELMEKYPEAYEEYMFEAEDTSIESEEDWRNQEDDILDKELQQGPDHVSGHGGGLLRRILSRNLSQGSIKGSGPNLKHSPRAKGSSPVPHVRTVKIIPRESPRKASAPAVLSPGQHEEIFSASSSSSRPQRSTLAVFDELDAQRKVGPSHSNYIPSGSYDVNSTRATPRYSSIDYDPTDIKCRKASPNQNPTGRQARITKRTSLSSLAETGFVAPPTPGIMKYHNVIPARTSLYLRQKSRVHSRDDMDPLTPDHHEHSRSSLRPRTSNAHNRRSLLSKKSQDTNFIELKTFSNSDADHQGGNMNQLVTDIEGLMSQLTTMKRRLSERGLPLKSPESYQQSQYETPGRERKFSALLEEGNIPTTSVVDVDYDVEVPILATLPSMRSMSSAKAQSSSIEHQMSNASNESSVAEYSSSDDINVVDASSKSPFPPPPLANLQTSMEKKFRPDL